MLRRFGDRSAVLDPAIMVRWRVGRGKLFRRGYRVSRGSNTVNNNGNKTRAILCGIAGRV